MEAKQPVPADSMQLSLRVGYACVEALEPRALFTAVSPITFENGIVHVAANEYNQIMVSPYFAETGSNKVAFLIEAMKSGSGFGAQFSMNEVSEVSIDSQGAKNTLIILRQDGIPITVKFALVGERTDYVFFSATDEQYVAAMIGGDEVERQLNGNADDLILAAPAPVTTADTQTVSQPAASVPAPTVPTFSTQPVVAGDAKHDDALWA